jgi:hypothetical protein
VPQPRIHITDVDLVLEEPRHPTGETRERGTLVKGELLVTLHADGRIEFLDAEITSQNAGASWRSLGWVWEGGRRMVFVRAEIAGESWTSLVQSETLDLGLEKSVVTLIRQTGRPREALSGWTLFC